MGASERPDYEEIARLERELGIAPSVSRPVWPPYPVPPAPPAGAPPPPEAGAAPMFAVCRMCGNKVHESATACNHCGSQEFRVDEQW